MCTKNSLLVVSIGFLLLSLLPEISVAETARLELGFAATGCLTQPEDTTGGAECFFDDFKEAVSVKLKPHSADTLGGTYYDDVYYKGRTFDLRLQVTKHLNEVPVSYEIKAEVTEHRSRRTIIVTDLSVQDSLSHLNRITVRGPSYDGATSNYSTQLFIGPEPVVIARSNHRP